ncbi:effector-associated constant component EACC1 [Micromonospora haikouensis]|uniref:effector-associated constant component EACC1 n=1 Tax=Micromonospora haikouensis TaxID=686309 RepID=UPI003D736DAE
MVDDHISEIRISILNTESSDPVELVNELDEHLREKVKSIDMRRIQTNELAQDAGLTLSVILGSATTAALVNGVFSWIKVRNQYRVQLKRVKKNGEERSFDLEGNLTDEQLDRVIRSLESFQ